MYAATSARVIALGAELTRRKFFGSSIQLAHRSEASSIVVVRTRKLPQSSVTTLCGAVGAFCGVSAIGRLVKLHLLPTRASKATNDLQGVDIGQATDLSAGFESERPPREGHNAAGKSKQGR